MPVFVVGTGRCGTSVLQRVLGEHPGLASFAWETRLFSDPGGLGELLHTLTAGYTPYVDALDRLEHHLAVRLTGREASAFRGWDLPADLGRERYPAAVRALLDELTWYAFDESQDDRPAPRRVARWFADRTELAALLRRHVGALFAAGAADRGKPDWCEKTPLHLLWVDELLEVFPEAYVVHVVRDPYEVVASHLDQFWAPDDVPAVCSWLAPMYARWSGRRETGDRTVLVRLEDLAAGWPASRAALFGALGLPDHETPTAITPDRVAHRGRHLTAAERDVVTDRLGEYVAGLGYPLHRP